MASVVFPQTVSRFGLFATASLAAVFGPLGIAQAQTLALNFTNIADSNTPGIGVTFGDAPAINNSGAVAFVTESGVFRGSGGPLTTILSAAQMTSNNITFLNGDPAINDSGTVVFAGGIAGPGRGFGGVFTGNGGALTTIAGASAGFSSIGIGDPSINGSGTVAFSAGPGFADTGVFTGNGGALTTVASAGGASGFSGFGAAAINNTGTVAFLGVKGTGNAAVRGVFLGNNGATTVALATGGNQLGNPALNNSGTAAFFGAPDRDANADGVFAGNGGALKTIVDINTNPNLFDFEHPSINDAGAVAFDSFDLSGNEDAFLSLPDSTAPTLLFQTGDTLFGATLVSFFIGRFALNNGNQVAFSYSLDDGRSGVAVANIAAPVSATAEEPSALLLCLTALSGLFLRCRKPMMRRSL